MNGRGELVDEGLCTRCGEPMPTATSGPESAIAQGWISVELADGQYESICGSCRTDEEVAADWPDYPPADLLT